MMLSCLKSRRHVLRDSSSKVMFQTCFAKEKMCSCLHRSKKEEMSPIIYQAQIIRVHLPPCEPATRHPGRTLTLAPYAPQHLKDGRLHTLSTASNVRPLTHRRVDPGLSRNLGATLTLGSGNPAKHLVLNTAFTDLLYGHAS